MDWFSKGREVNLGENLNSKLKQHTLYRDVQNKASTSGATHCSSYVRNVNLKGFFQCDNMDL